MQSAIHYPVPMQSTVDKSRRSLLSRGRIGLSSLSLSLRRGQWLPDQDSKTRREGVDGAWRGLCHIGGLLGAPFWYLLIVADMIQGLELEAAPFRCLEKIRRSAADARLGRGQQALSREMYVDCQLDPGNIDPPCSTRVSWCPLQGLPSWMLMLNNLLKVRKSERRSRTNCQAHKRKANLAMRAASGSCGRHSFAVEKDRGLDSCLQRSASYTVLLLLQCCICLKESRGHRATRDWEMKITGIR